MFFNISYVNKNMKHVKLHIQLNLFVGLPKICYI